MRAIVTGGCGFAGAAVTRALVERGDKVLCIDPRRKSKRAPQLAGLEGREGFVRLEADATDKRLMRAMFHEFKPDCVFHLTAPAGEEPEDLYATGPAAGFAIIEASLGHLSRLPANDQERFRFIYGLHVTAQTEDEAQSPRQVMALCGANLISNWARARGLPAILCAAPDLFGPFAPETSLLGGVMATLFRGETATLSGGGETVRDWLYVRDYAAGMLAAADKGEPDTVYGFTVEALRRDEDFFGAICDRLDALRPRAAGPWRDLLRFEHDLIDRGVPPPIDPAHSERDLGWRPAGFHVGLERMIAWALRAWPEGDAGFARAAE